MRGHKQAHHEPRKDGGKVEPDQKEPFAYNAKGSEVEKEAEEKSRGGRAKRAKGGHVEGMHKRMRLDKPGRKRGGGVGSDMRPLTTAAKVKPAQDHDAPISGNAADGP